MKPGFAVLCCCGFARLGIHLLSVATSTAEWHEKNGTEGCDHVTSIEHRERKEETR